MEPSTCLAPSARLHLHRSALSSALLQFSDKTLCLQPNRFYNRSFSRHLPPHCVITATSDSQMRVTIQNAIVITPGIATYDE